MVFDVNVGLLIPLLMFLPGTPSDAVIEIRDFFNRFHFGSDVNILEIIGHTLTISTQWTVYAMKTRSRCREPGRLPLQS